jgi:c(7)-type cytochrome triheme protein
VVKKMLAASMVLVSIMISSAVVARQHVGGGDLVFTPENAPRVFFSHEDHLKAERYKCASCHYRFFQMAHGSWKMDMEKMTKGEFCGKCHDGRTSFSIKDRNNCSRCHR